MLIKTKANGERVTEGWEQKRRVNHNGRKKKNRDGTLGEKNGKYVHVSLLVTRYLPSISFYYIVILH
jgi:hypothetical protein